MSIQNHEMKTSRKQCKDVGMLITIFMLIVGITTGNGLFDYLSIGACFIKMN